MNKLINYANVFIAINENFKLNTQLKVYEYLKCREILNFLNYLSWKIGISRREPQIYIFKEKIQLRDNLSTFVASVLVFIIATAFSTRMALTIAAGGIEPDSAPIGFAIGPID